MIPPPATRSAQRLRLAVLAAAVGMTVLLLLTAGAASAIWFSGACWAVYLWGTLRPGSRLFGPVISKVDPASRSVTLTIDDGPDLETTPALLALLRAHEAKAVFFVIGDRARQHPELIRAILGDGHEIGNHSMTHPSARYWCQGPSAIWREIAECNDVLRRITGGAPRWYRSPVGHSNPFVQPVLTALGLRRVAWSARGYDAVSTEVAVVMQRIVRDLRPGAVVLLHEATPIAMPLLETLLIELSKRQLTTRLLGDP
jgi:peptidoglycan-N-acetylglucosamine deacetylase